MKGGEGFAFSDYEDVGLRLNMSPNRSFDETAILSNVLQIPQ